MEIFDSVLSLNAEFCRQMIAYKNMKYLYAYALSVRIMAELGYMKKKEFISSMSNFACVSTETSYRWLRLLKSDGIISEKDGVLYIQGKRTTCLHNGVKTRLYIKLDVVDLRDYSFFIRTVVRNIGIIYQNRFRYCLPKIYMNKYSPHIMKGIKGPVTRDPKKVGVSISYLAGKLNLSKTFVQKVLVGATRKNYVYVGTVPKQDLLNYRQAKKLYTESKKFDKSYKDNTSFRADPRYRWIYKGKGKDRRLHCYYATASTIVIKSNLVRRGR